MRGIFTVSGLVSMALPLMLYKIWDSQMLVDLSSLPVLPQQTTQYPLSPHPQSLGGHTSLCRTLSLTRAGVTTLALSSKEILCASSGVDDRRLDDNASILDELLDVRARVGVANLRLLSGVEPDFALTDAGDGRGEPLLRTEIDHGLDDDNDDEQGFVDERENGQKLGKNTDLES